VRGVGDYTLLGQTLDDAAGEAFDKTAKLLGLPYPGGPALEQLATRGRQGAVQLPRPMMGSGDLDLSFSGLKTAVSTLSRKEPLSDQRRADLARAFQEAIVDVLTIKAMAALDATGLATLVVAGGVGANGWLRQRLLAAAAERRARVCFPDLEFCTDNGAMIALVGALRLERGMGAARDYAFGVHPRWPLESIAGATT
jgi:N6-L-threonylcarbamoyladenine synthase